jgi:predicted MFS family arabinose efflux permease
MAGFLKLERRVARRGGMPLIDLSLLADKHFMRGLGAAFFFFFANLSFYFVMTVFMQRTLRLPPLHGGLVFVPLALTFVVASRHAAARAKHRGQLVMTEGCAIQIVALAALALLVFVAQTPSAWSLAPVLAIFGYGQGFVMAPLPSLVLASVKPASAGAGSGMYGTTAQIANAAGVAAVGAVFFAVESIGAPQHALFAALIIFAFSIMTCVAFLSWMRRAA